MVGAETGSSDAPVSASCPSVRYQGEWYIMFQPLIEKFEFLQNKAN